MLLTLKNLYVAGNGKKILNGIDFQIRHNEVQALLGPNGSGKSTLAQVILGNPKYEIIKGGIFFEEREITKLSMEKRAKLGIALSWQSPPAIKGVKLSQLLEKISKIKFESKKLDLTPRFLERELNLEFSGGEKKLSELLQILSLKPKLVIFDEIDSGLDIKKLEKVAKIIKKELVAKGISILLITHSGTILRFLKPKITNVILNGKIICKEKDYKKVLRTIRKYDYEKCKKCKLLAD
ncbi:MAG: ATP-binding cassette domain-containing protein [Patescibacteria group bacterium]|nr:ATP-binding cassette domain-containing protein [Patescibacteria group bacterium]